MTAPTLERGNESFLGRRAFRLGIGKFFLPCFFTVLSHSDFKYSTSSQRSSSVNSGP
jgi:hypothetical protein